MHPPVSPADAAATRAYLQAVYQLDRADLNNATASRSVAGTFAQQLGQECHGVLAGEPKEEEGPPGSLAPTPRARGELQRSGMQEQTINHELSSAFFATAYELDRGAVETYDAQVARLNWSNPKIAPLAQLDASLDLESVAPPTVDVCSDMSAWAHSGYHVLSTASRAFQQAQMVRSQRELPSGSIGALLKPYEDAADRRLIRVTKSLQTRIAAAYSGNVRVLARLQRTLGVPESSIEEERHAPMLGRRTTRDGATVTVRSYAPREASRPSCQHSVSVEFSERSQGSSGGSSGHGDSLCIGSGGQRHPSGSCGSGVQSITAAVPPSVRAVRLVFSDGHTITSRVIRIPRSAGGPAGVYAESIRGYSPYPVSLAELDARGHVVKSYPLKEIRCMREPPPERGPTLVDLADVITPYGEQFTIQGLVVHFGHDETSFNLALLAGPRGAREESGGQGEAEPKAFSWSLEHECPPHEYTIIYGILSVPGDSVWARTPSGLTPLTEVALAPDLHSGGPLEYGVFSTQPAELVVRRSDGATLDSESLASRDEEETEFCQGYAEG
jgi:hypothetical protein